jgi:hypothetical protein
MATMVTRTTLTVTFYVHVLPVLLNVKRVSATGNQWALKG